MAATVGIPDIQRDDRGRHVVHLARRAGVIAGFMFGVAVAAGIGAGGYAFVHG